MIPTKSTPTPRIAILAAGRSSRLGQSKALARVRGESLLESTVKLLAPLARADMLLVIPPRANRLRAALERYPVRFIENSARDQGLSTSVRCALIASQASPALLIVPVDLPDLKRREIARLIACWRARPRAVMARRLDTHRAGIPVILPRRLFARARCIAGDRGLKDLIDALPRNEVKLLDVISAGADVDTRQDLDRARRRLRHA
jgi:molybdenum cofactor cytidylyltransferase